MLSRDEAKRGRALASLREDPGLQQLLPHLCTFIQSKVGRGVIAARAYFFRSGAYLFRSRAFFFRSRAYFFRSRALFFRSRARD